MIQTNTDEVVNESIIKDIDSIVKTSGLAAEDKIKQIETILSKYNRGKESYRDFYTLRFMNQQ